MDSPLIAFGHINIDSRTASARAAINRRFYQSATNASPAGVRADVEILDLAVTSRGPDAGAEAKLADTEGLGPALRAGEKKLRVLGSQQPCDTPAQQIISDRVWSPAPIAQLDQQRRYRFSVLDRGNPDGRRQCQINPLVFA